MCWGQVSCLGVLYILLAQRLLSSSSSRLISATVGQDVTLPCKYPSGFYGLRYTCWGRGHCHHSGFCPKEIISSDKGYVSSKHLDRHQLLGNIKQGDVSLTVVSARTEDSGDYCCFIYNPGWSQGQKQHVYLLVKSAAAAPAPWEISREEKKEEEKEVRPPLKREQTTDFDGKPQHSSAVDLKHPADDEGGPEPLHHVCRHHRLHRPDRAGGFGARPMCPRVSDSPSS
ncbi:T-cell immunoglobulin and mucin domain-containing protein 4-like [Polypterus senegalus]|uniref:T-cell immunoglobulin and mucin domain-containing protein 4-like n=1 Tax=Polypterus senegalus TaxID=55291 RepID=UPI001962C346|nr:T-cell immunoglobulin and mucin domain-containing protein 4-like [Polypterus senegalus]